MFVTMLVMVQHCLPYMFADWHRWKYYDIGKTIIGRRSRRGRGGGDGDDDVVVCSGGGGGGGGDGRGVECRGIYTLAYDILARYQTLVIEELLRHTNTPVPRGQERQHPHPQEQPQPQHQKQQQKQRQQLPKCAEISTTIATKPSSAMDKCNTTNINNEAGIMRVPSSDDSNNHDNSKYDDRDPKSNSTSTMPPSSNTRPTDHRRRQRPRQGESGGAIPWWILTDGDNDAPKKNKKKQKQIDIAFSTCLRFLVWGGNIPGKRPTTGIVTEEVETNIGPALLTMPSDFVPRCSSWQL